MPTTPGQPLARSRTRSTFPVPHPTSSTPEARRHLRDGLTHDGLDRRVPGPEPEMAVLSREAPGEGARVVALPLRSVLPPAGSERSVGSRAYGASHPRMTSTTRA